MLVISLIYLISPVDLIPGPPPFEWIEDIPFLIGTLVYTGLSYRTLKKREERDRRSR